MLTRQHILVSCLLIGFALVMMTPVAFAQEAEQGQEMVICPQCSVKNLPDAKFCIKCGTNLKDAKRSKPVQAELPVRRFSQSLKKWKNPSLTWKSQSFNR